MSQGNVTSLFRCIFQWPKQTLLVPRTPTSLGLAALWQVGRGQEGTLATLPLPGTSQSMTCEGWEMNTLGIWRYNPEMYVLRHGFLSLHVHTDTWGYVQIRF